MILEDKMEEQKKVSMNQLMQIIGEQTVNLRLLQDEIKNLKSDKSECKECTQREH